MKKKIVLMILTGMMCLSLAGCGKSLELTSEQITVELGGSIDVNASDLVADEELAAETVLDFSAVDVTAVGTYTATATYKEQTKEFEVVVADTVAPVADILENATIAVGEPLYAKDLVSNVTELSGRAEVTLSVATSQPEDAVEGTETVEEETENVGTEKTESTELPALEETFNAGGVMCTNDVIVFDAVGTYELAVVIADASGNQTEVVMRVSVGEAPVISGVEDIIVTVGTDAEDIDYLDGVTAVDCRGNDITADIVCDSSAVDLAKTGEYELAYTVADADGFTATEKAVITVEEKSGKKETAKKTDSKSDSGKTDAKTSVTSNGNVSNSGTASGRDSGSTASNVSDSSGNSSSGNNNSGDNNSSTNGSTESSSGNGNTSTDAGNSASGSSESASTPSTDNGSTSTSSTDSGSNVPEGSHIDPNTGMAVPDGIVIEEWNPDEAGSGEDLTDGDGTSVWN